MCSHVVSFAFGISGSWPAAGAAHWFPCVSTCSWRLGPQRCRRPLTPTRRYRSGLVHFAAALWLCWSVSLLFRSRSGLHLRFKPPNMRTHTRHRSFNASKSGRYRYASNAVFLRSARFQQTYPYSLTTLACIITVVNCTSESPSTATFCFTLPPLAFSRTATLNQNA
jgi:hypothetical protein